MSRLGNIGLVDHFEQAIHAHLRESIYWLEPMPTTWAEWKCKTSLLNNQWRRFQDTQPKATTTKLSLFCSPPVITSTTATSSSFSKPSTATAPPAPQPIDLDRTNPVKKDPHSGLCFNCCKLGDIMKVCRPPCTQNICNVDATMTLSLAP